MSYIDPSKPTYGKAYTSDVRQNFSYAKQEIEALQTAVDSINGSLATNVVSSFMARSGAVTLLSNDVLTALGYTPYDANNPAGYQNSGQVTTAINNTAVLKSQINVPFGVAPLNSIGVIPATNLPASPENYRGTYNAATNTPVIGSGGAGGVKGDYYIVNVAGTVAADSIGACNPGDKLSHNGTIWQRIPAYVAGVAGMAFQDPASVNITGGVATLTTLTVTNSVIFRAADPRNPTIAKGWADSTGAFDAWINPDGSWRLPTLYAKATTLESLSVIGAITAASGTITTLNATTATFGTINSSALNVTGGNPVFDTITLKNSATWYADPRNPAIAKGWGDSTGGIGAFIDPQGNWRIPTLYVNTLNTVNYSPPSLSPQVMNFGTAQFTAADRRNRYAAVWTDNTDQGSVELTSTGSFAFTPANGVLGKHLQNQIERGHVMTMGPPEHSGSANTPGAANTTYHMIATLDTNGFDAIRLIFPSMNTPAGATITACIAPTANPNDPLNPKDASGNPVTWRPVGFGSQGVPTDWHDQPEGTIVLTTSGVSAIGQNVITTVNTTGAQVGMIVQQFYATASGLSFTDNYAVITAVSPTSITIDRNIKNFAIQTGQNLYLTPTTLIMPPWGGTNNRESVKLVTSDWIPLSSLDRSDTGGRWPLIMVRVYATGGAYTSLVTSDYANNWLGFQDDRIWKNYTQTGDFVSPANQLGFTSNTENGTMIVGWIQYYSRAKGCTIQNCGDSIMQGINNGSLSGLSAVTQMAWMLSKPECPVTNVGMVNGWNYSGLGTGIYDTAIRHVDVFQPHLLFLEAWSRNGEFNKPTPGATNPTFEMENANYYWQQCLRITHKVKRKYRTQVFYYPMPPSNAYELTSTTCIPQDTNLKRAKLASDGGELYYDPYALMGVGSNPTDTKYPGLHPPADAQMLMAYECMRVVKNSLGVF